jgi:hypothetical protein
MILVALCLCAAAVCAASLAAPPVADPPEQMTLMGTLSDWKYPGSNMLGGATMSDGGNPRVVDVKCRAILITPDPIEKVVAFYAKKLDTSPTPGEPGAGAAVKEADAKAVSIQDDSAGRPLTLRVFVVNRVDTTTTLVVSRAAGEKETHIAWMHYRQFDDGRAAARP